MRKFILMLLIINVFTNICKAAEDYSYDWDLENEQKIGSYNSHSLYRFDAAVTLPHMASGQWSYELFYIDGVYIGDSSKTIIDHTLDLRPYADGKIHLLRCTFTYAGAIKEYICYFMAKTDPIDKISYWFDNTMNTATVCGIDNDVEIITIPETVKFNGNNFDVISIGQYGIYNNINLKNLTLPSSIVSIEQNAFQNCLILQELNIPESVNIIKSNAFNNTPALKALNLQRGGMELNVEGSPFAESGVEDLFLGRDVKGKLGIGNTLQSLQVGSNVTYIENNQFNGCTNLNSVKFFEGNLNTIGSGAFQGCSSLKEITIPNTVESIKSGAFNSCKALETVNLSSKLTEIADETFKNCTSLFSIKLPDGITSIGNSAFYGCLKLEYINLPDWITKIGDGAFSSCAFRNITLPKNLKSLGKYALTDCWNLISIDIPNSVTSIGESAFSECSSLEEVNLSENLTSISSGCFQYCNLQQIKIPDKVTEIETCAFYCNDLNSIELPSSLTTIGDSAFDNAGPVTEITIPANVTKIGAGAFDHCDNLITVNSLNSVPPTCQDAKAFSQSTYKSAVLWVPAPSVEDYMTFIGWKEFKNYDALEAISSIKLTGPSNILRINKTMDLEATVSPSNISAGNLKWSTSNPIVATVDNNGTVKALSPGYVVITAKSQDIIATEGTYELTVMDYLLGDSNESDDVTITDAVNIASYVMGENPAVFNFFASDVNQSNDITLADASGVISIILDSTYAALANSARRIKTADNDVLKAEDFSIYYGETANVSVSLESENVYVALQADVTATNGLTISDVLPSACLDDTHMFITKRLTDDAVRIIIYSPALNEIPYNGNSLFDIVVTGSPGEGSSIKITNILATDTNLQEHQIGFEGGNCESLSTGITDINGSASVKTEQGVIIVKGAEGNPVTIYSINGMVVASTKVAAIEERFALTPGTYIVTLGSNVEKVIVR